VLEEETTVRRLSDLRRAQPADATMQNLLGLLTAKLEFCSRLPVFEHEARLAGHRDAAATFRELAAAERESFNQLLLSLQAHLSRTIEAAQAGRQGETPEVRA
jgi:hypothetical protein